MRVFIDTAPLIYIAECRDEAADKAANQIRGWIEEDTALLSSVMTLAEILVHPKRENNLALVSRYKIMLNELLSAPLLALDAETAEMSAELRAKYRLSAPDALQVACAVLNQCGIFYSNDRKLCRIEELKVVLIGE